MAVVEIAAGAPGLLDPVDASPEEVRPVALTVQLFGYIEPDFAPVGGFDPRPVEPVHLLLVAI